MATTSDPRTPQILLGGAGNSFDLENGRSTAGRSGVSGRKKCTMALAFGASVMLGFCVFGPMVKDSMLESASNHHRYLGKHHRIHVNGTAIQHDHDLGKAVSKFLFISPGMPGAGRTNSGWAPVRAGMPESGRASGISMNGGGIQVTGIDTTVTDPIRDYTLKKMSKPVEKFEALLTGAPIEVHLKIEKRGLHESENSAHIAEITAYTKTAGPIRAKVESDAMYASIDELSDMVTRKLRKIKERNVDGKRKNKEASNGALSDAFDDDDDDPEDEDFVKLDNQFQGQFQRLKEE